MATTVSSPPSDRPPGDLPEAEPVFLPKLYEVVGAEVVEKTAMGAYEVEIAALLWFHLSTHVNANQLGRVVSEMLFDLRPAVDRSRRPDLAFVSAEKWPLNRRAPRVAAWTMVPELVIEVVSPTDRGPAHVAKVQEYLTAGVRLVWVMFPLEGEIHIYDAARPGLIRRLLAGDTLDAEPVIAEFRLPLAALFAEGEAGEP